MTRFATHFLLIVFTIGCATILALIILVILRLARWTVDRIGLVNRARRPVARLRFNLWPPSKSGQSKRPFATRQVGQNLVETPRTPSLGWLCIGSFVLGAIFTLALAGLRVTSWQVSVMLPLCATAVIVLQLLLATLADGIRTSAGTPDGQDINAVHECLTKAGFSEPPGVSAKGTVYIRPYWGTVYVHEGGYWEHQIAFAKETLAFEGYGAKTLESHLRLLELTGRPALSKA